MEPRLEQEPSASDAVAPPPAADRDAWGAFDPARPLGEEAGDLDATPRAAYSASAAAKSAMAWMWVAVAAVALLLVFVATRQKRSVESRQAWEEAMRYTRQLGHDAENSRMEALGQMRRAAEHATKSVDAFSRKMQRARDDAAAAQWR